MFAGKQREESETLHEAADRAFSVVTSGLVQTDQLDELVADAIAHFLRGSRAVA